MALDRTGTAQRTEILSRTVRADRPVGPTCLLGAPQNSARGRLRAPARGGRGDHLREAMRECPFSGRPVPLAPGPDTGSESGLLDVASRRCWFNWAVPVSRETVTGRS